MAERILSGKIKQLIYTTEELSQSPLSTTVIDNGVLVYEKTSSGQIKCKMGDGNNVWSELNYIEDSDKMDKNNPTGTGSLSLNRLKGSIVGENSVALGSDNVSSNNSFAIGQKCVSGSYIKYDTTVISEIENNNTIHYFEIYDLSNTISVNDEIILVGFNNITSDVSMFKSNILSISETTDSENNTFYKLKIDESKINFDDYEYILVFIFDTSKENIISSYAEGYFTSSNGMFSHAEGYNTTASGDSSHSEGSNTTASGDSSHSEGSNTTASGAYSHAEGSNTTASGNYAHAEGVETKAYSDYQHVQGKYNIEDTSGTYAHIVGGGIDDSNRKNIHTLDWEGNAVFSGDVVATDSNGNAVSLLNSTINSDTIVSVSNGGTGYNTITDITYTTARYRASSLNSSETTPTINGVIAWTYE